ncbi:protein kinase [Kitasatospora sp. NPDC052896]|uniref:protein kinase domain-containing protein n=1 Tax=Kitasatospora sp. NPDC052896 TaxID=3364061 RepID=UPI0037CC3754
MIGRALNGRYELVGALGVGGMATVWHGVDRVLNRPVAVKVLNGGLAEDPRFAERFAREAQHAAMLVHPRIAMVFDSGMDGGSAYIVMELVRGRSLSSLLAEGGPLPVERTVGVAAAVCEALEVAHAAGLVHRDIKPGNIMITDDGGVKVVDFGIARASASGQQLTQTATVLGTAAYLSPEQATAAEVDGRADLYALGCVLVEMLTGEPPFTAETPVGIAFKQVSEEPVAPSRHRPDVPPALDAAVLRLLAKRPADRPADAAAARAELLAAVPVAGAVNRTTELLTSAIPVQGDGFGRFDPDAGRTSVLPPQQPAGFRPSGAPTSVMAPMPEADAPYQLDDGPAPRRSRTPALLLGAAGLVGVVVVGAFAFAGSNGGTPVGSRSAAGTSAAATSRAPGAGAAPVGAPGQLPGGPALPLAPTTAGPAGRAGAELTALRAEVAQSALSADRQAALLKTLDTASAALTAGRSQDAVQQLRGAQRQVRDLVKKHAVDGATSSGWQRQLGTIIGTLGNGASVDANDGDNGGN